MDVKTAENLLLPAKQTHIHAAKRALLKAAGMTKVAKLIFIDNNTIRDFGDGTLMLYSPFGPLGRGACTPVHPREVKGIMFYWRGHKGAHWKANTERIYITKENWHDLITYIRVNGEP